MQRLPRVLLVCAIMLTSCMQDAPDPQATGSPDEPPVATLEARGIPLFPDEDGAARFIFESAERSANVIVNAYRPEDRTLPVGQRRAPEGLRISLCPVPSIDADLFVGSTCRNDIGLGVREPVSAPPGVAVVAQGLDQEVLTDIVIQYPEAGREVSVALSAIRGPRGGADCSDNACNPFFALRPTQNGRMRAGASWDGPEAQLVLFQGNVLGRAQTATGIPYHRAAADSGASPLSLRSHMSAPGEYALAFQHRRLRAGEPALRNVVIEAEWP